MIFTLIGMPGAGKSCMGRTVSGKLRLPLIDSDKLIEKRFGKKLQTILDELGVDEFRRVEEEVLLELTSGDEHVILSTGGSAVYYPAVMDKFKKDGIVVYLYASAEVISNRLVDFSKRGVVLKEGMTMQDLYNERAPLFEKYADVTVNCDGTAFAKYRHEAIKKITDYLDISKQK